MTAYMYLVIISNNNDSGASSLLQDTSNIVAGKNYPLNGLSCGRLYTESMFLKYHSF